MLCVANLACCATFHRQWEISAHFFFFFQVPLPSDVSHLGDGPTSAGHHQQQPSSHLNQYNLIITALQLLIIFIHVTGGCEHNEIYTNGIYVIL